jgi:hypothetical protein
MPNQKAIIKLIIQQSCVESRNILRYAIKWTWIDCYGIGQEETCAGLLGILWIFIACTPCATEMGHNVNFKHKPMIK